MIRLIFATILIAVAFSILGNTRPLPEDDRFFLPVSRSAKNLEPETLVGAVRLVLRADSSKGANAIWDELSWGLRGVSAGNRARLQRLVEIVHVVDFPSSHARKTAIEAVLLEISSANPEMRASSPS